MKKSLILLLGMALLTACTQETVLSITPDISSFQFDAEGGAFDVVIFTNGSWTATCEDEAVTLSPASGDYTTPMHITVGPNDAYFTKSIRIDLKTTLGGNNRKSKIVITQSCGPFIFSEETVLHAPATGGTVRFHVNANDSWKVVETTCDGEPAELLVEPLAHGPNRAEVTVRIPENRVGRPCTYAVKLALEAYPAQAVMLTVEQAV